MPPGRGGRWLHFYAVFLSAAVLLLIVAGAMVTSTGSGLSVPDWPTSYGYNMFTFPLSQWVGGIFYEHGHRLIASGVGFLTIGLAVWLQWREPRRWLRVLGWIALGAVIFQGILGGLTVRYLLPTPISVAHACLAQSFLCLVLAIAVFTSPAWSRRAAPALRTVPPAVGRACLVLTGVVFVQLLLGAVMRHTGSGLAVPDFPLAYGGVLPSLSAESLDAYNDARRWEHGFLPEVAAEQIVSHLAHRYWAILVVAVMGWTAYVVSRRSAGVRPLVRAAAIGLGLVGTQIALGAWTVLSGRHAVVASLHVAVGAATLACAWFMTLQAFGHRALARSVPTRAASSPLPARATA